MLKTKIRSITYTVNLQKIKDLSYQQSVKNNIFVIKKRYEECLVEIRTVRFNILVIDAFPDDEKIFLDEIRILASFAKELDIRWFNIAFDMMTLCNKNQKRVRYLAYYIIKNFKNAFVNLIVTDKKNINIEAVKESAKLIQDVSKISTNGFDNFRVGISLNPSIYTPFFPFSYSNKEHSFSLAMEVTQLFLEITKSHTEIDFLRESIFSLLGAELSIIDKIAKEIESNQFIYNGLDSSLAPYPDENVSVIDILRTLGLDDIGSSGTLFLTSMLTNIIKKTLAVNKIRSVGFNGVMYSLLEDKMLSNANDRKLISIDQLLSYSTMCGCGLDMVPLPGDILQEELESIILDTAAIAIKLDKPLGVRVLPIPNKSTNEFTSFDMDFLTNTRVLNIRNLYCNTTLFQEKFTYRTL